MLTQYSAGRLLRSMQRVPRAQSPVLKGLLRYGPFVLSLLLPGGTLVALLLYLYRRHVAAGWGSASSPVHPHVALIQVAAAMLIVLVLACDRYSGAKHYKVENYCCARMANMHSSMLE